ncbi:MAG TPA: glycosyltransferase family 9 protein [Thermodesulfobacteriota bacterium]|nr:glycosyltransferase family 9 protein [Thermodesulfobacteriota bacterium]
MNWKIEFLKRLDSTFGRLACSASRLTVTPRKETDNQQPKVLVIRPGGIGDAVLLYPALKVLKEGFPNAEINILAEKRNYGILYPCPYIDGLFRYDFKPPIELLNVLKIKYDMVIDTEQWHRLTSAISYLTGAPVRVGFATNERAELFSHAVPYSHCDYEVYSFLNLVSSITGQKYAFDGDEPFIPVDSSIISKVAPEIEGLRKKNRAIAGMFGGATVRERKWGIHRFAQLAKDLLGEGLGIVLVGGKSDLHDQRRFEEILGKENFLSFVGRTSLMETAAVISLLDLFVTGDTGLMHVSYGVGTPTVSLFGAGIQKKWAPIGKNHIVINKNLRCSPCTKFGYTPKCPYGVKCLNDIAVNEVKEAVLTLLLNQRK